MTPAPDHGFLPIAHLRPRLGEGWSFGTTATFGGSHGRGGDDPVAFRLVEVDAGT